MQRFRTLLAIAILAGASSGCGSNVDDGIVDVAFIGEAGDLAATGLRMQAPAQHLYAAETQGLVRLDAGGNVVPGLAERWLVTDDGRSYIFRVSEFDLPGGGRLSAQTVRESLLRTRRQLAGTSLGLDLARIAEIRAMTGRVIEFRLTSPMPEFLQLLAQPELGIAFDEGRGGPMKGRLAEDDSILLNAIPPEERGLPRQPEWDEDLHAVRAFTVPADAAARGFADGRYDLVLGGTVATLPLAGGGALTRGTIRLDASTGLLGFDVRRARGFLGSPENREAVAMAIDRAALMQPFNIGGWVATSRLVAPSPAGEAGAVAERWANASIEARRATAGARVARWRAQNGAGPNLSFYLPAGPGSDTLFAAIARDLAGAGISARRVDDEKAADLALRDRVARYASPYWFLNQFNCKVSPGQCSPATDYLVAKAAGAVTPAEERGYLAEAETTLTDANLYIPLGAPIRWSLARASLRGFAENPWNIHPLFPLSRAPI